MEVLSTCLNKSVNTNEFSFHWRIKEVKLNHLIFADDVFLFCKGDLASVNALMHGVTLFSSISSLHINTSKSQCFLGNVNEDTTVYIMSITGFSRGSFPVKYLGLHLISTKLNSRDCIPLVNKFCDRIEN